MSLGPVPLDHVNKKTVRLQFGECTIDVERRELRRAGAPVHVEPQVLDLILYLIRHRDRVVSKDMLLEAVWQGRIVSDSALSTRINAARQAIGDSGKLQTSIRTLARRGFRFVADVEEDIPAERPASETPSQTVQSSVGPAASRRPGIAVLPFENAGGPPDESYFAEGMAEALITSLSQIRWLMVIGRGSSFSFKERGLDARRIGHELNVRYLLEGAVRRAQGRVRIMALLIEAETGQHLWGAKFDGEIEDVFDLQDRITANVIGAIEPSLRGAEIARAERKRPQSLDAYDLYLRALPHAYAYTREGRSAALELGKALDINSNYAEAHALAVGALVNAKAGRFEQAIDLAERALRCSPFDPNRHFALAAIARAKLCQGNAEAALVAARGAVHASPGHLPSHGYVLICLVRLRRAQDLAMALDQLRANFPSVRATHFSAHATFAPFSAELQAVGLTD